MRVLGVDPGLTRCGLGVVDGGLGQPLRMSPSGSCAPRRPTRPSCDCWPCRPRSTLWLDQHTPDAVAVERVFAKANVKGIMGTAQASAVPMLAAARRGLPVAMHTPTEVKAAVTGNGRADKAQVTAMVTRILGLTVAPRPPTPPTPWPSPSATSGAAAPRTACSGRSLPRRPRWPRDDRLRQGSRPRGRPRLGRGRGRGSRPAGAHHPRHGRRPARAARGAPGHHPGRARGLADPLRLRRRRRARHLRAGADRLRRRAAARAGDARRARPRRLRAGREHRRPRRPDQGARHRQEGRRADRARAARQDRPAHRCGGRRGDAHRAGGGPVARPGPRGARRPRLVGQAGRRRRRRSWLPVPATAATSPGCCAPRCGSWAGERPRRAPTPTTPWTPRRASSTPAATTTSARSRRRCGPSG